MGLPGILYIQKYVYGLHGIQGYIYGIMWDIGYTRIQGYRGIQEEKGVTGFTEPANREFRG